MFENIIGQDGVVETLRRELSEGSLPRAVLFHGPAYSGKLSTALEVARALTCEKGTGEWSCPCRTCAAQRLLTHPYTLLLGPRYFELEIGASADALKRTRRPPAQYLFTRAVRKLTRRFDPLLWEGEESRVRALGPLLAETEEFLETIAPGAVLPEEGELEKGLERVVEACGKIASVLGEDNIPIQQIRRAVFWMHLSSTSRRKVVVLENADRMFDASRNSLLKILEEPPEAATLILLATNRGGLLPTIRSRLRAYELAERGPQDVRGVLSKIFHDESAEYASLGEYFLYWRDLTPEILNGLAQRFIERVSARSESVDIFEELAPHLSVRSDRNSVSYFLEALIRAFQALLHEGRVGSRGLAAWSEIVRAKHGELTRYNQNPGLVLESLYYRLREVPL